MTARKIRPTFQNMADNCDHWRTFKVGDLVRVVEFAKEFRAPGALHVESRRAYKYLLNRRRPLTVSMIDEYGLPWTEFQYRGRGGRMGYHSWALNHSGLVLVKRKRRS
jgi:hypothetical protein